MTRRVLVVEDDPDIGRLVTLQLAELDCESRLIADGVTALAEAEAGNYDLVILDLMLPRMDGLQICRRLRTHSRYTPILMLTAKSSELDRVLGLELGADDYLTKPFSMLELAARVKAVFRRADHSQAAAAAAQTEASQQVIEAEGLRIDMQRHEVLVDGKPVPFEQLQSALGSLPAEELTTDPVPSLVAAHARLIAPPTRKLAAAVPLPRNVRR